jgi:hypothetical protein
VALGLPGFGGMLLACGVAADDAVLPAQVQPRFDEAERIEGWTLDVEADDVPGGAVHMDLDALVDWRDVDALRHSGGPGVYRATVVLPAVGDAIRVVAGLGRVDGVAEVYWNGRAAGRLLVPPFEADVTALARDGGNDVEVRLFPPPRNRYVGKGLGGDPRYRQFTGAPEVLAHAGLIGPTTVRIGRLP